MTPAPTRAARRAGEIDRAVAFRRCRRSPPAISACDRLRNFGGAASSTSSLGLACAGDGGTMLGRGTRVGPVGFARIFVSDCNRLSPHEADDVLDRRHGFGGQRPRADRNRRPAPHRCRPGSAFSRRISAVIGASFATSRSASAGLKAENCAPPNSLSTCGLGRVRRAPRRCRRDCRPRAAPPAPSRRAAADRDRSWRVADLLRDRVGVVGQVDARLVGRVRLRHLLGAVAQRHHPRRRALDQRLGQRKERLAEAARSDRRP